MVVKLLPEKDTQRYFENAVERVRNDLPGLFQHVPEAGWFREDVGGYKVDESDEEWGKRAFQSIPEPVLTELKARIEAALEGVVQTIPSLLANFKCL
jgi:hypothetical protein